MIDYFWSRLFTTRKLTSLKFWQYLMSWKVYNLCHCLASHWGFPISKYFMFSALRLTAVYTACCRSAFVSKYLHPRWHVFIYFLTQTDPGSHHIFLRHQEGNIYEASERLGAAIAERGRVRILEPLWSGEWRTDNIFLYYPDMHWVTLYINSLRYRYE